MLAKKQSVLYAVAIMSIAASVQAAGKAYPVPGCADPGCVPRRVTYGYTPTTWRKWPSEPSSGFRPRAEELPTPATEPTPGEPTKPGAGEGKSEELIVPEESPLVPTEKEAPKSKPADEELLMPPFEEGPPAPPRKAEDALPRNLNNSPEFSPITPDAKPGGSDSDPPPTMPDEDPFKDDPPPSKPPADAPSSSSSQGPALEGPAIGELSPGATRDSQVQPTSMRWRVTSKSQQHEAGPVQRIVADAEPAHLHVDQAPARLPTNSATRQNPLRTGRVESRSGRVVPTSAVLSEQRSDAAAETTTRRNPLRAD